jgi:hypothetical protein
MMGDSDALIGDLGFSTMDNGKAVRVSWICEFLTEAEFGRVLPAVAKTLTVLMHKLNTKWGNTNPPRLRSSSGTPYPVPEPGF